MKILDDVLSQYECSRLLAHCLSETVQAVRKKRQNGQNHESLTNHNYLKSVYETQKVSFVATPTNKPTNSPETRMAEDKRRSDIEFISCAVKPRPLGCGYKAQDQVQSFCQQRYA